MVAVFNGSDGVSRFNWTGTILTDLEKMVISFEIRGKTDQNSLAYDKLHLKGSVDTCEMSNGPVGNLIAKMGMSRTNKFTNFKMECPHKKGLYYAVNYPVPDDKFIPYAITNAAGKFEVTSVNSGKVAGVEGMVHISTTKLYGTAVENPMIKM